MIGKFSVCPILLAVTIFCGGKLSSLIDVNPFQLGNENIALWLRVVQTQVIQYINMRGQVHQYWDVCYNFFSHSSSKLTWFSVLLDPKICVDMN